MLPKPSQRSTISMQSMPTLLDSIISTPPNDDVDQDDSQSSQAVPQTFEDLLPYVCNRINGEFEVLVKKESIRDEFQRFRKSEVPLKNKKLPLIKPMANTSRMTTASPVTLGAPSAVRDSPLTLNFILVTALYDNSNKLTEITIYNQRVMPRLLMQAITIVAPYFNAAKITLKKCVVDGYAIQEINNMLMLNKLTEVILDDSRFPHNNVTTLLDNTSNLKHLSLSGCKLNDTVCAEIASKLHHLCPSEKNLIILNLSSNHITDDGAKYIGEMLRTNRQLRFLNMAGNLITDDGAAFIFDVLIEFPLTYQELMDKRRRVFNNLKKRKEIIDGFVCEYFGRSINEVTATAPKSKKILKTSPSVSPAQKHQSFGRPEQAEDLKARAERLALLAEHLLDKAVDPFGINFLVTKNEWMYCIGNFVLCYINLAYNNLTYYSLKKLATVLSYQFQLKSDLKQESSLKQSDLQGILNVNMEGNLLPDSCKEYSLIHSLINKILRPSTKDKINRGVVSQNTTSHLK